MALNWSGLFIGVGTYFQPNGEIDREMQLAAPPFDARRLRNTFTALSPNGNLTVLTDDDPTSLPPIRNKIFSELVGLLGKCKTSEPLVFYFAGHGFTKNNELYLQPSDFQNNIDEKSSLPLNEILDILRPHNGFKLIICDCCRAEMEVTDTLKRPRFIAPPALKINEETVVIWSCSNNQFSFESLILTQEPSSLFSYFFTRSVYLQMLRPREHAVSLYDVFEMTKISASEYVAQNTDSLRQTPALFGGDVNDWIIIDDPAMVERYPDLKLPFNEIELNALQEKGYCLSVGDSESLIHKILADIDKALDQHKFPPAFTARGKDTNLDEQGTKEMILRQILLQTFHILCKEKNKGDGNEVIARSNREVSRYLGTGTISVASISASLAATLHNIPLSIIITTVSVLLLKLSHNTFCAITSDYLKYNDFDL